MAGTGLIWDLIARDNASPAFLRVAGAADKAAASTERAAAGTERSIARISSMGAKLTKSVTLPIVAIGAVSLDMAAKFQQSTNVLVTAAGESTKNLALVRKGILDIAASTGTSWKSVTDGMYQLEKAGYRGADALKVEKAAAQGAREEGANLATVTAAMTSMMASYHLPASKAVMVMNEMKTAAGESKTTMEAFAGSLSTVLPLASANKISFADIGGSLATLTQHGTSADEATQELAFTMRGLSAPNQVAQKEMAQLGISSVDVASKLGDGPGGRGLAGTLKYLSDVVRKRTGPDGNLVLSTLNASKITAHDATVEFNALAPATQKVAKAFIAGTMTQHDWTLALRDMTPQQSNLARQFAVTENNARGFQQMLRNGVSVTQTASDALKKMTGGASGLNTVLQVTGESMKGTEERIKRIQDAAKLAGTSVSGWASTQKLFAVQMDMFKQRMAVVAIQIGTALLPAGQKLLGWVQSAVHWFSNLSDTQKQVLGWSVGVLAAIGPVLAIGGRLALVGRGLGTFAVGLGNIFTRITTGATGMSLGVTRAVSGVTSALAGVGIGVAVGSLTKNSSTTTKVLGSLGAAAAGAAIGFGVGGPIGAAIGGLGAGLGSLAVSFLSVGKSANKGAEAAKAALAAQKQDADDLLGSLQAVNGAYDAQYRNSIIKKLDTSGALGIASKAGVNLPSLVDSVLGKGGVGQVAKIRTQIENAFAAGKINPAQYAKLDSVMQSLGLSAGQAEKHLQLEAQAAGAALLPNSALGTSVAKLRAAFNGSGTAIDNTSGAGLRNTAVIKQNLDAINASAVSQLKHGKSVASVASAYESQIGTLHKNLDALHFNDAEVGNLIGTYARMPKSVLTELIKRGVVPADIQSIIDKYNQMPKSKSTAVGLVDHASGPLSRINAWLLGLPTSKTVTVTTVQRILNPTSGGNAAKPSGIKGILDPTRRRASGGAAPEGFFWVGEGGPSARPELVHKAGPDVQIMSTPQSMEFARAMGIKVPGFASGTTKAFAAAHAGLSSSQLASAVSAIAALLAAAHNTSDSAADIRNAAASLRSAAHDSRLTNRAYVAMVADAKKRDSISARLGTPSATGTTAYDRLAAAKTAYSDNYTSSKSATGAFDITQLGIPAQVYNDQVAPAATAGSILTALTTTAATAGKFAALLKRLIREGMPRDIVLQLAAAGPSAIGQAQALAAATPAQIAGFKRQDSLINAAGSLAGKSTADAYYLSGVRSAQGLVNGLLSQRNALNKAITRLADGMVNTLKHKLKIHSPSQVMFEHGANTGEGFRLGVESKLAGVQQASSKMASAARPSGSGGGQHTHYHEWNISGQMDPVATANAALRRLEAALAG